MMKLIVLIVVFIYPFGRLQGHVLRTLRRAREARAKISQRALCKKRWDKKTVLTGINENLPTQGRVDCSLQIPNDTGGCRRVTAAAT